MGFKTKSQKIASVRRKTVMQSSTANSKPALSTSPTTTNHLMHEIQKTLLLTAVIMLLLVILKVAQLKNYF